LAGVGSARAQASVTGGGHEIIDHAETGAAVAAFLPGVVK
jgi:hypothetical protein